MHSEKILISIYHSNHLTGQHLEPANVEWDQRPLCSHLEALHSILTTANPPGTVSSPYKDF